VKCDGSGDADHAAGRQITCPLLFLWAAKDDLEELYGDPLAIWRDWADDVRGQSITAVVTSPRRHPMNSLPT
jgi:hypothetical protein